VAAAEKESPVVNRQDRIDPMKKRTNGFCAPAAFMMALVSIVWLQGNACAAKKDGGIVAYANVSGAPGPVVFSHLSHGARRAGYTCKRCHTAASGKMLMVTMDDIRRGRACGACHDGRTKKPRGRLAAASIQDCSACHMPANDIVIPLNRMDPVAFSHIQHLAVDSKRTVSKPTGLSCGDCHPVLFERKAKGPLGMKVPHESGACAQCHNGQKRSDGMPSAFAANTRCLSCHQSPVTPP
jgi:c(7)-type cytochrome triheme protein